MCLCCGRGIFVVGEFLLGNLTSMYTLTIVFKAMSYDSSSGPSNSVTMSTITMDPAATAIGINRSIALSTAVAPSSTASGAVA